MSKAFWQTSVVAIIVFLSSFLPAAPQTSACEVHDQMCIYHGIGKQMGYDPSGPTSITATANWDQANDADLHALLPTGNTYSAPTEALPGYPLQISEPFFPDVSGAHIYPNHYETQINGGGATTTHSGDAGGGEATYLGQPGCDPAIQSSVTCEAITVQGEVPSGVYSYALHAFPETNTSFPLTNFSIDVRASGNMVLVTDNPGLQINPETGLIRQTGSFQGSGATTSQLDVYALNVGHAGHVGGVTIPQMELVRFADGIERYQPAEPLLFDETPSIQDQIAGAFMQRDQQVAYYEDLREQEKQRLARIEAQRQWNLQQQRLAAQMKAQDGQNPFAHQVTAENKKMIYAVDNTFDGMTLGQIQYTQDCLNGSSALKCARAKYALYAENFRENVPNLYINSVGNSLGASSGFDYVFDPISGNLAVTVKGGGGAPGNGTVGLGVQTSFPSEGTSVSGEAGVTVRAGYIPYGVTGTFSGDSGNSDFGGSITISSLKFGASQGSYSFGGEFGIGNPVTATSTLNYTKIYNIYGNQ